MSKVNNSDLYTLEAYLINKSTRELEDGCAKYPIDKLRLLCLSRGATGILQLSRSFRNMFDDTLNEEQFIKGIQQSGLHINVDEIKQMFRSFDENGSGIISMADFLMQLRTPMSQRRLDIISKVFRKMDKNGEGKINFADVKRVYSVIEYTCYINGDKSEEEILQDFLKHFEGGHGDKDSIITEEEFLDFYAAISASIENDINFDLMMRNAFKL